MIISVIGIRGFPGVQGGVEKHCENIYPRIAGVRIRVYRRKPYLSDESLHTYPGIEYVDFPSTRIGGFEAVWHTFLSVLHILFHRPDVVHIHNIGPGMFSPLLKLFGLRVVMTYHSPNYEHDKWGFVAKQILKMSEFLSLNFVDRVIFVNKFQMEKYPEKIRSKSVYVPNGINDVSISKKTDFLEKHGIKAGNYLLGVGRLTPEKGFEYLVEAANRSDEVSRVVIAGASDHDSGYLEKLKELDRKGKVIFTGFTSGEDLRQLYSHAKMFVLSSVNEGFPLVLLEAMSYGLPVVVSDIPATHLLELPAERYFRSGDSESLRKVIDSNLACGDKPDYNLAGYDWAKIAARTCELLRK